MYLVMAYPKAQQNNYIIIIIQPLYEITVRHYTSTYK